MNYFQNATAPTFYMQFWNGIDDINVNMNTRIDVTMATTRNINYDEFDMEFIMPIGVDSPLMHVCKVEVTRNGKNTPCLTPEFYNKRMQYFQQ